MNNLERQIWELCGSPMREATQYIMHPRLNPPVAKVMEPIEIGLAHVMQLLGKQSELSIIRDGYMLIRCYRLSPDIHEVFENIWEFVCAIDWKLLTENNEAALLRDQGEETKLAILEAVKCH